MTYSILIVDDSSVQRSIINRALSMTGLPVGTTLQAGNGVEALELLTKQWVDVLITDLNMPEMDGSELISKVKDQPHLAGLPIVVVSSDRSRTRLEELRGLGIENVLPKPVRPEVMKKALESVIGEGADS